MMSEKIIEIIQPDDWYVHLRQGDILNTVSKYSFRINNRCVVMPNLTVPVTTSKLAKDYVKEIYKSFDSNSFTPLVPCYLTDSLDLDDFKYALENNIFIGAKLYPYNVTTNSNLGVTNINNIYPALEILQKLNKNLTPNFVVENLLVGAELITS